jgi:hypothetical protein
MAEFDRAKPCERRANPDRPDKNLIRLIFLERRRCSAAPADAHILPTGQNLPMDLTQY